MDTERQKENGMSDYNRFFENSWERFLEIISDVKEIAASEDTKAARERVEDLKEISDDFKNIDTSKLSDDKKKFCKHFMKSVDRIYGLYNRILDTFENNPGEVSNKEWLKLVFAIFKDLSLASRDLNIAAKKYNDDEEDAFCEMTR